MSLLRHRLRGLPSLCVCVLLLAWVVESQSSTPGPESSHWNLVRNRVKNLVEPIATRTRDRWQWFWSPKAFGGFMQTYYEDHWKDLGQRTQNWLQSSKESLLNKTYSLCPRLLCKTQTEG